MIEAFRKWALSIFVVTLALCTVLLLLGCASGDNELDVIDGETSYQAIDETSFQDAIQVFPINFEDDTTLIGIQVNVNTEDYVIRMQCETSTSDAKIAERDAEQAAKAYSEVVAYAQAANSDDERTKAAWNARGEQEEATEGIGSLYDYYSLSMTVTNEDGTLSLVGNRPAGVDSVVTWEISE